MCILVVLMDKYHENWKNIINDYRINTKYENISSISCYIIHTFSIENAELYLIFVNSFAT